MGLDMTAYSKARANSKKSRELSYWRKHPNLQGWMEQLWRYKTNNTTDDFNCVEIELTLDDLDRLEEAVLSGRLPETTGFFYGQDADDYYKRQDLAFIEEARGDIKGGRHVYYSSWW